MKYLNKTIKLLAVTAIISSVVLFAFADRLQTHAQGAALYNFKGKVTTASSTPVADGTYDLSFALYTQATGGAAVWSESLTAASSFSATISGSTVNATTITYNYSGAAATTTLRVGGYLTNAGSGAYVLITDFDTTAGTVTVAGTSPVWANGASINNRPRLTGGVLDVNLGTVSDLSTVNFNQSLYLEVIFNSETMQPRKVIGSVPNAFNASRLANRPATDFLTTTDNATITGSWNFANGLGVGTSSAASQLSVYGNILAEGANRYFNFGTTAGSSGYGFRDNGGTIEVKNFGGSWTTIGAGGSGVVTAGTAGQLAYYAADGTTINGTSTIFLKPNGYFGIGTSTPANILTVGGILGQQFMVNATGTIVSGIWQGSPIAVGYGGTGSTTLTANGLLMGNGSSAILSIAPGGEGEVLTIVGGVPTWAASSSGSAHNLFAALHSDTLTAGALAAGDLIYRNGANQWTNLAASASGSVLIISNNIPAWTGTSTLGLAAAAHLHSGVYEPLITVLPVAKGGTATSSYAAANKLLRWNGSYFVTSSYDDTDLATSSHIHSAYQPIDSTLTSLAAYNTNGILVQTSADTFTGRTLATSSDKIIILNPNGVNGNPSFDVSESALSINALGGGPLNATGGGTGTTSPGTLGALVYSTGSAYSYIATGTDGYVLRMQGNLPTWVNSSAVTASHAIIDPTYHTDATTTGSLATGALFYRNASNLWTNLAIGVAGDVLLVSGGIPSWNATSSLGLAAASHLHDSAYLKISSNLSDVASTTLARSNLGLGALAILNSIDNSNWSGTPLAVTNGGTGTTTLGAVGTIAYSTGSTYGWSAAGANGQVLSWNNNNLEWIDASSTTSVHPIFGSLHSDTATSTALAAGDLIYRNGANQWTNLAASASGSVLIISNNIPAWTGTSTLGLAAAAHLHTGTYEPAFTTLAVSKGGTGSSSLTLNGVLYGDGTNAVKSTAAGTNNYLLYSANGTPSWTSTSTLGLLGSSVTASLGSSYVPKWTGSVFNNSLIYDTGSYVGIGTNTPSELLTVDGNIKWSGDLMAATSTQRIGSAGQRINSGYFVNLDVLNMTIGSTSISGSVSDIFTINSDNTSADLEDSSLAFHRGSVSPDALITWKSANDWLETNFPLYTGTNNLLTNGSLGVGTTSPSALLTVGATSSQQFLVNNLGVISDGTWQADTIGVQWGGTGSSSLTVNGLLYGDGTNAVKSTSQGLNTAVLYSANGTPTWSATGTNGYALILSGGVPTWSSTSPGAAHPLLGSSHLDTNSAATPAAGDLLTFTGASQWDRLPASASGSVLIISNNIPAWSATSTLGLAAASHLHTGTYEPVITVLSVAKGGTGTTTLGATGTIAYSTGSTYGWSAAGSNGQVLSWNNNNLEWIDASSTTSVHPIFGSLHSDTATSTALAAGDLIYRNGANQWTNLAASASGSVLIISNNIPAWTGTSTLGLAAAAHLHSGVYEPLITVLPVAKGGTATSSYAAANKLLRWNGSYFVTSSYDDTDLATSSHTHSAYQPIDSTLTSLAAYNTNGILVQNAPDSFIGRTLATSSDKIIILNPNGVDGNPSFDVSESALTLQNLGGVLTVAKGGTGTSTAPLGAGEILFSVSTTQYDHLAAGAAGYLLMSNGATAPSWIASTSFASSTHLHTGTYEPAFTTLSVAKGGTATSSYAAANKLLRWNGSYFVTSSYDDTDLATSSHTHSAYQPIDATLTSLAAYNTNGILVQNAPDSFIGRTLATSSDKIIILNPNGVNGNPSFDVSESALTLNNLGGTLSVAKGGTGSSSLTVNGLLYGDGTNAVKSTSQGLNTAVLYSANGTPTWSATGTNGYALILSGGVPTWSSTSPGAAHPLLGSSHLDTNSAATPAAGDLLTFTGASQWDRLPASASGSVLIISNNIPAWSATSSLGLASSTHTHSAYQPIDSTLTSLAAYNTNGILVQNAPDSFIGRTLATSSDKIIILNPNGVDGNPSFDVSESALTLQNLGGVLTVAKGGTGTSTAPLGAGEILFSVSTTQYDHLAAGAAGYLLMANGATAPSWIASTSFASSTHLHTGTYEPAFTTLSVAKGGTGSSSLTVNGVLYGDGTNAVKSTSQGLNTAVLYSANGTPTWSATGTNGYALIISGGVPTWSSTSPGAAHPLLGAQHTDTNSAATPAAGDLLTFTGASQWDRLPASASGSVLIISNNIPAWSATSSLGLEPTISILPIAKGGTATSSYAAANKLLRWNGSYFVTSSYDDTDLATSSHTHSAYQPIDATLTSLAAYNTNGILVQTSADTFTGRTLATSSDKIIILNPNGVDGNPSFDVSESALTLQNLGGVLTVAKGGTGTSTAPLGAGEILFSVSTTQYDHLAAGAAGYLLMSNGATAPSWIASTSFASSTHLHTGTYEPAFTTLSVAKGGTGSSSLTLNGILYGDGTNAVKSTAAGTNNYLLYSANGTPSWIATSSLGLGSGTVNSGTTGQLAYYSANGTAVTGTSSLFLATSGFVGIGTTTPGYRLTINSSNASNNLLQIATTTNQSIFVINSQGRVGIGTSTPGYDLDVAGTIRGQNFFTSGGSPVNDILLPQDVWNYSVNSLKGSVGLDMNENTFSQKVAPTVFESANTSYISAAALTNGNALIAYSDVGNGNYGTFSIVTPAGSYASSTATTTVFESANTSYISAVALPNGNVLIAYQATANGKFVIYDSAGNLVKAPTIFRSFTVYNNSAVALPNGNVLIAYMDTGNSNYGTFVIYDSAGNLVKAPTVFKNANTQQISAVALPNGNVLIVYQVIGSTDGVFVIYDSAGNLVKAQTVFDSKYTISYISPSALPNGNVLIAYFYVPYEEGPNYGALVIYDSAGNLVKAPTDFDSDGASYNSAVALPNGNALIAYQDSGTAYGTLVIYDSAGNLVKAPTVFQSASVSSISAVALSNGNVLIAYQGSSGYGTFVIYQAGAKFSNGLAVLGNTGLGTSSPSARLTVWGAGTGTGQLVNFVNSASTTLFTVLENGRVGIGTSSPASKLSVYGDLFLEGSNRYLNFGTATGTNGYGFFDSGGTLQFKDSGGSWYAFASSTHTHSAYQPIDATLTSLAAHNTNGFLVQTAADTFAGRTFATSSNMIVILNADGVSGNPTFNVNESALTLNNIGGTLSVTKGGTGSTSLTVNGVLYGDGTNAVKSVAQGTNGYVLWSNNGTPEWTSTSSLNISGGSGTVNNGTQGQLAYYSANGTAVTGTSSLFIASNSYVGIGTTTPGTQLTVVSTLGPQLRLAYDSSKYVDFTVASDGQFTISPTGYTGGSVMTLGNNLNENVGMVFAGSSTPFYLALDNADGKLKIGTSTTIGSSTLLTITPTGYLGIGTTSPSQTLAVNGLMYIGGTGTSTIENNLNVRGALKVGTSSLLLTENSINSTGDLTINGVTITPAGNMQFPSANSLAIGTTTASSKLTVYGDAFLEGSNRYLNFGTATGTNGYGFFDNGGTLQFKNSGGAWYAIASSTHTHSGYEPAFTTLSVTKGGTGSSSLTLNGILYGDGTNAVKSVAQGTNGYVLWSNNGTPAWTSTTTLGFPTIGAGSTGYIPYYASSGSNLTATSTLFISTTGNIGISTTTPGYKLTINSTNVTDNLLQIATTTNQKIFNINYQGRVGIGTDPDNARVNIDSDRGENGLYIIYSGNGSNATTSAIQTYLSQESGGPTTALYNRLESYYSGNPAITGVRNEWNFGEQAQMYGFLNIATGTGMFDPNNRFYGLANIIRPDSYTSGTNGTIVYGLYNNLSTGYTGTDVETVYGTYFDGATFQSNDTLYGSYIASNATSTGGKQYGLYVDLTAGNAVTKYSAILLGGNVGIGTTSPSSKLSVYGDMFIEGLNRYLNFGTATGTNGYGFFDNGGTLQFKNSGGSWYAIASSTHTHSGYQTADATLTSLAAYNTNGFLVQTAADTFAGRTFATSSNMIVILNADGVSGNPTFNVNESALTLNNIGGTLSVTKGGTGSSSLTINGVLYGDGTNAVKSVAQGTNGYVLWSNNGTPEWTSTSSLNISGGSGTVNSGTTGQLAYYSANGTAVTGTSSLYLATNGYVGIGTTTPIQPLTVVGAIRSYDTSGTNYIQISHNGTDAIISASTGSIQLGTTAGDLTLGSGVNIVTEGGQIDFRGSISTSSTITIGDTGKALDDLVVIDASNWVVATSGDLILKGSNRYLNFGATAGTSGYGFFDSGGVLQFKNSGGAWANISTSTIGYGQTGWVPYYSASSSNLTATSALFIATDGSVGIGTANPGSYKLNVNGTGNFSGDLSVGGNITAGYSNYLYFGDTSTGITGSGADPDFLAFRVNSGSKMYIDSSGNVGIGTTSPKSRLSIFGDLFIEGTNRYLNFGTATGTSGYGFYDNGGILQFKNSGGAWTNISTSTIGYGQTGWIPYYSASSANLTATSAIFIAANGNVGMGTTTPQAKLDITANVAWNNKLISLSGQGSEKLYINENADLITSGYMWIWNGSYIDYNANTYRWGDVNNSYDYMTLLASGASAGNLGIGTSSPSAKLTVWGGGTGTGLLANFVNAASTTALSILDNGTVTMGNGAFQYDGTTGVTSIDSIDLGSMNFDTDAGIVTWIDMPVATTTANIINSYTAKLDGNPLLTVYGATDGAGGVKNTAIGIGTTTPVARLAIQTGTTTQALLDIASTTGASLLRVDKDGMLGIGTTSPVESLSTAGRMYIGGSGTSTIVGNLNVLGAFKAGTSSIYIDGNRIYDSSGNSLQFGNTGGMGFGTSTASSKLTVYGDMLLEGSNRYINFGTATGSSGYGFRDNAGTMQFKNSSGSWSNFGSSASPLTTKGDIYVYGSSDTRLAIGADGLVLKASSTTATGLAWETDLTSAGGVNSGTAGQLAFYAADGNTVSGTSSIFIATSTGYIGIGTTTPGYKLTINSTNATDNLLQIATTTNQQIFVINNQGNVGIGDKTPDGPLSINKNGGWFLVNSNMDTTIAPADPSSAVFTIYDDGDDHVNQVFQVDTGIGSSTVRLDGSMVIGNDYMWGTPPSNGLVVQGSVGVGTSSPIATLSVKGVAGTAPVFEVASSTNASLLRILANGNVGIGQAAPSAKLEIYNAGATNNVKIAGGGGRYLELISEGAASSQIITAVGGDLIIQNNAQPVYLSTAGSNVYMVTGGGRVGIGTSSPSAHLTVWGTGTTTGTALNVVNSASTTLFTILDNGNIGVGTTNPNRLLTVGGYNAGAASSTATSSLKQGLFSTDNMLLAQIEGGAYFGRTRINESQWGLANYGDVWTEEDANNRNYESVAMSSDGKIQTAVASNGRIYVSTDYGVTWTEEDANTRNYNSVAMSSDGKIQTAVVYLGRIYVSTDYGATWTEEDANDRNYESVAMSSDGKIQTTVVFSGRIYVSTDYGVTWTEEDANNRGYKSVAMSSDGKIQTAVVSTGGIYVSTDYGTTWTQEDSTVRDYDSVAMSADGKIQTAVINGSSNGQGIYVSADYGITWTQKDSTPRSYKGVAMSSDGKIQTVVVQGGRIYVSTDYGATLTEEDSNNRSYFSVAMSSDGKIQTTVVFSGRIYVSRASAHTLGNVGIGTTTPSALLTVGATAGSQFLVNATGTVTAGTWQGGLIGLTYGGTGFDASAIAKGGLLAGTGAGTMGILTVGTNGYVMIASSTAANGIAWVATSTLGISGSASPLTTKGDIYVYGTGDTRLPVGTDGYVLKASSTAVTGLAWEAGGAGSGTVNSGTAGQLAYYAANGTAVSGTSSLFIMPSGYLGIGTTSPSNRLTVLDTVAPQLRLAYSSSTYATFNVASDGRLTFDTVGTSTGSILTIGDNANENTALLLAGSTTQFAIGIDNLDGKLKIGTSTNISSSTVLTMTAGGYLGIGTSSPYAKFSLVDAAGADLRDVFVISTSTSGAIFRVNSYGQIFADNGTVGTPADYAEYFKASDADLLSGEVVCIDVAAANAVKRCRGAADNDVVGIVSTKPLITGNYKPEYANNPQYAIVAMLGQIPAFTSAESGPIRPGDSLTSAKQLGYLARASSGDPTVGIALESLDEGTAKIQILISRRNKSLTVEQVEQQVTERVAAMKIEDEVRIMVANALNNLNLDDRVKTLIASEVPILTAGLTVKIDDATGQLVVVKDDLAIINSRLTALEQRLADNETILFNEIARLAQTVASSSVLSSQFISLDDTGHIKLGNNFSASTSTPVVVGNVAIVEISALSDAPALVVRQAGDGNIAEFTGPEVSVMTIEGGGEVRVVGTLGVDGRILVCSGGVCPAGLDNSVDSTLGDVGVEGKVVAGAYESYCDDGFVWVNGSSKYGTMPGFCVMSRLARHADSTQTNTGFTPTIADITNASSTPWVNVSQGEASLACQTLGDNYHLITENEWLTIAENALRIADNDIDKVTPGMQLATTSNPSALSGTFPSAGEDNPLLTKEGWTEAGVVMSNGNRIYDLVGIIAEWTDQTVTKTGLPELANSTPEAIGAWQEYYNIDDYKGLSIAPPYYYTNAANGTGGILLGSNDAALRGFLRGYNGLYSLDLSNAPTLQSPVVGFRCAK